MKSEDEMWIILTLELCNIFFLFIIHQFTCITLKYIIHIVSQCMEENKWSDVLSNCIHNAHHLLWKNPNTDSLMSCTERQIQQFTCSLQHIPKNGVVIKNDQCISTLTHITHDIKPIINLMLKCSECKKVLLIFFNVVLLLVVNECWTEEEDVNELSPEGGAWETDQVSCLSWVKQSNNQQVERNTIRIQIPFILFICGFPVRRHLLKYWCFVIFFTTFFFTPLHFFSPFPSCIL